MPNYEFQCNQHGVFSEYRTMGTCTIPALCPECEELSERIFSVPNVHIVQGGKRLPLGTGSPGRMVTSHETGGMGVFIPSFGAMEQKEVDYIAEGAIEKEKSRVNKAKGHLQRKNQEMVQSMVNIANKAKRGQKAKAIKEALTGG